MAYTVRRLKLGRSERLDRLSMAAGDLYSRPVVTFWRVGRKKDIWLSPGSMMKILKSEDLYSQSSQATVQAFCASLKSWRQRRKVDPRAGPPTKRRKHFKVTWKGQCLRIADSHLVLPNGRGNDPLLIPWKWDLPTQVEIGWDGEQYELRAVYVVESENQIIGTGVAGIDLGEIHSATTYDGKEAVVYNGRLMRSKRRYQNKVKAAISSRLNTKKRGSRRHQRLKRSKDHQLRKLRDQIRDIEHKQTRALVSTLQQAGVQTLVIGDVRDIRTDLDYGKKVNQKLHQWTFGVFRWNISYKWKRLGGAVVLTDERGTSSTCPSCGYRRKPTGRSFRCGCGFRAHRDAVGAINIRSKYQGCGPVVGDMAPPLRGVRFHPHLACSSAVSVLAPRIPRL